jgi:hypothetical protein
MKPQIVMVIESAAAAWDTTTDVLEQDTFGATLKQKPYARVLRSVAVVGDAALDGGVNVTIGNETVAKICSTNATAFDSLDKHLLDAEVLPGEIVQITPYEASAANPYVVYVEFDEHPLVKLKKAQAVTRNSSYKRRY